MINRKITIDDSNSLALFQLETGGIAGWDGWSNIDLKDEIFRVIPEFEIVFALIHHREIELSKIATKNAMTTLAKFDPVEYKFFGS